MQTYFKKRCWIKRMFKNKACNKNIRGTSNCQPALPRLQIRTRGLCWKHTKNLMSFFSLILKKTICAYNLLGCNLFISYRLVLLSRIYRTCFFITILVLKGSQGFCVRVQDIVDIFLNILTWWIIPNPSERVFQLIRKYSYIKKWPISYRITSIWTQKSRL